MAKQKKLGSTMANPKNYTYAYHKKISGSQSATFAEILRIYIYAAVLRLLPPPPSTLLSFSLIPMLAQNNRVIYVYNKVQ